MAEPLPQLDSEGAGGLEAFTRVKLIVADLDGTLVRSGQTDMRDLAREQGRLRRHGVGFTIATGRTLFGVRKILDMLRLPQGFPVVLYNGSVAIENDSGRPLYRREIPSSALERVIAVCTRLGARVFIYQYRGPPTLVEFPTGQSYEYEFVEGYHGPEGPRPEFNGLPVRWNPARRTITNPTAIVVDATHRPEILPSLVDHLGSDPEFSITPTRLPILELRPQGNSKALALNEIVKKLGLDASEVLAVGDNDNDAEMLQWAGLGIAVSDASPKAIASCDFIASFGHELGVVEVLKLVNHAKRFSGSRRFSMSDGIPGGPA